MRLPLVHVQIRSRVLQQRVEQRAEEQPLWPVPPVALGALLVQRGGDRGGGKLEGVGHLRQGGRRVSVCGWVLVGMRRRGGREGGDIHKVHNDWARHIQQLGWTR